MNWFEPMEPMEWVEWNDPRIARITRLRFLSEPGYPYWDYSYGLAVTKDGTEVRLFQPDWVDCCNVYPCPHKPGKIRVIGVMERKTFWSQLFETAKRDGVHHRLKEIVSLHQ
jgi:hypothetical protein